MSQEAVERAVGKLVTDELFRKRFFAEPAAASVQFGLNLSRAELDALLRLPRRVLEEFGRHLDDRICRLRVDAERS